MPSLRVISVLFAVLAVAYYQLVVTNEPSRAPLGSGMHVARALAEYLCNDTHVLMQDV